MTRHHVPGYEHALHMRAVVRALLAGTPVPSVDTPVEELEALEPEQVAFRAPDDTRRARLFAAIERGKYA